METLLALLRDPAAWAALATLVAMEIVLGIDNLIFISILTNKLPEQIREKARRIGIGLALIMRLALLATIAVIGADRAGVHGARQGNFLARHDPDRRGAFLVWKAT
jgi:predicted tellurium resistance membrane protein TerC